MIYSTRPLFLAVFMAIIVDYRLTANAQVLAKILSAEGNAEVVSDTGERRPAKVYGSVYTAEKLMLQPASSMALGFRRTGAVQRVKAGDEVLVCGLTEKEIVGPPGIAIESIATKKRRQVAADTVRELYSDQTAGVTIMRSSPEVVPPAIVPIDNSAIAATKPTFSWPAVEKATSYEVTLKKGLDQLWKINCKEPRTQYPDATGLEPGNAYNWVVVAKGDNVDGGIEGTFQVVYAEDVEPIDELGTSDDPALLVLAAFAYEQNDLVASAIDTFETLAQKLPREPAFHAALAALYARAGREQAAKSSRAKAEALGYEFRNKKPGENDRSERRDHDDMIQLAMETRTRLQQQQPIDHDDLAAILAWSGDLDEAERQWSGLAQIIATRVLWNPHATAAVAAAGQPDADLDRILQQLTAEIRDTEKQLVAKGVTPAVAMLGRLSIAEVAYQCQQLSHCRDALSGLADAINEKEIWAGMQARYWNLSGLLASEESQFALAFEHHARALRMRQKENLESDVAESLNNIARLQLELGDYDSAGQLLETARKIYAPVMDDPLAPQVRDAADVTLINLSKSLEAKRDFDASRRILDDVAARRGESVGYVNALLRNNFGLLQYQMGDFQQSREQLSTARQFAQELFGANNLRTMECEVNLAWLDLAEDQLDVAQRRFETALQNFSSEDPNHHRIAEISAYLARVAKLQGDQRRSRELLETALARRHREVSRVLASALSERDRLAYIQKTRVHFESISWPGVLDTFLTLAPTLGISDREQYRHVLAWKGILSAPIEAVPTDQQINQSLRSLRSEWANVRDQLRRSSDLPRASVLALERRAHELERSVRSAVNQASATVTLELHSVVNSLPKRSALLDVIEVRQHVPRTKNQVVRDNRIYIGFLLEPSGNVQRIELGDAAIIDAAIEAYVGRIESRRSYRSQARRLDALLGQPIQNALGKVSLLLISADGMLHRVPWASLPRGETEFWGEDTAFAQVHSARQLLPSPNGERDGMPKWLVVGGVDYGRSEGEDKWPPLKQSAGEAREIHNLMAGRFAGEGGVRLLGAVATRDRFLRTIPGMSFIHVATHGSFDDQDADAFQIHGAAAQLDSFLVFAGANEPLAGADALVTAEEIGTLDLAGTEVVTLSACETGLGHIRAGQGVIGLVDAFGRAGARSVVSALWKVDDTATAKLMENFYHEYLQQPVPSAARALQVAQQNLRSGDSDEFRHPFYWAPWTVSAFNHNP
jgi:CHAT domain-containing protein